MSSNYRTASVLVLAIVSFSVLSVISAFAQAGLSGNPFSGQADEQAGRNSTFDNGKLKSTSALGQLEEMTGSTVDRSSSQYSNRNTVTRVAPQPAPAKPRYDPNQAFKQELASQLIGGLLAGLLSDDSAQRKAEAEAAAARAAAEAAAQAEAYRVQQELARQARIRQAQHYRAEWDSREGEITNRLGGAFEVHTSTAFFGRPANPDADIIAALIGNTNTSGTEPPITVNPSPEPGVAAASSPTDTPESEPSVVDLRGSSLVAPPTGNGIVTTRIPTQSSGSLMPRWAYEWAAPPPAPPRPPSELDALLGYFGPWLGKWYKETVAQGTIKSALFGLAKRKSQYFGENMVVEYGQGLYGFQDQKKDLTEALGGRAENLIGGIFGEATDVINGRVSIDEDAQLFDYRTRKLKADNYETVAEQMFGKFEPPDPYELKSPTVDYNFTPVRKISNGDEARINSILFSPAKNTSKLVTNRNINGLPGSYGPPPATE